MSQRPRSERGDTLVEVIVSIAILAIVSAGLLAGMTTTTVSSNLGRDQAFASVPEPLIAPTSIQRNAGGECCCRPIRGKRSCAFRHLAAMVAGKLPDGERSLRIPG